MKKTLLASAVLLAFVSGANAQDIYGEIFENRYVQNSSVISENHTKDSKERVLGGYRNLTNPETALVSEVNVSGGTFDMAVGGHYHANYNSETKVNVKSTKLTIEGATVEQVIGGTSADSARKLQHTGAESSTLIIKSGTFGLAKDANNTPELLVVGGDLLKFRNDECNKWEAESSITTTNTNISGGTFDAAVIGGSAAIQYYSGDTKANYSVKVGTANTTITGGTFNDAIVAGGFAYGDSTSTVVDNANLTISGANGNLIVKENIYAGGMVGDWGSTPDEQLKANEDNKTIISEVGKATVSIDNATVKKIYGAHANYTFGPHAEDSKVNDWFYRPHETEKSVVDTTLNLTNVKADAVQIMKGEVNLRAEGAEGGVIVDAVVLGDGVAVSVTGDGAFNDSVGGDIEKAKDAFYFGGEYEGTVVMEEGAVMGAVTADGEMQVNTKTEALADKVSLAPQMIQRIMMNDVRKRMGDLRAAEGTHGVWARYNGGQMSGSGVDADFNMIQVGIDTIPVIDAPRFGVAFSYAETEAKDNLGTTDMDSFSLAFYGTKMYDNGMFVDVIGRMATMDSDIVNAGAKGKMDNVALSLSGELGWRFDVTNRFFFEPSVEATYTYTNADTFTMTNGGTYELEAVDSLVGRAGFATGFKCPANKGDVYVRAAVVHEFMGDMTVNSSINGVAAASLEADGKDTWFEYAIGANFNVNKNTYVYADIERTEGAAMDEDWRANVGVRFAF